MFGYLQCGVSQISLPRIFIPMIGESNYSYLNETQVKEHFDLTFRMLPLMDVYWVQNW